MAERIEGYNENKDYTGFVCQYGFGIEETYNKLKKNQTDIPVEWTPHPEGFIVKEDCGEDMLIEFYDINTDIRLGKEFWIKFEDAVSYWA